MHELTVCASVVQQVLAIAADRNAWRVGRITLRIGPLAGVEPDQLQLAFPLVTLGTACEGAAIAIERTAVRVSCKSCRTVSEARANRLLCADCGTWRVVLVSGDEMLLARVELIEMPVWPKNCLPRARSWAV